MFDFKSRIRRVQKLLQAKGISNLIIASGMEPNPNVLYYTGDSTTPIVIWLTPDEANFYGSQENQSFDECSTIESYRNAAKKLKGKKIAVDERANGFLAFSLQKKNKVIPFWGELMKMREVKEPQEARAIQTAQELTKKSVFSLDLWDKTENRLAGELELEARKNGCALNAFPPIVISNETSAIPHGVPGNRTVRKGDVLLFDVGVRYENYCADFSHTFYEGHEKQVKDAVEAVKESQKAAIKLCKPGVRGKKVAEKALEVLKEYGFEKNSHKKTGLALGHLVGLDVHDGLRSIEWLTLKKGHVFTIEPGVYFKGKWGIRFEDIVCL